MGIGCKIAAKEGEGRRKKASEQKGLTVRIRANDRERQSIKQDPRGRERKLRIQTFLSARQQAFSEHAVTSKLCLLISPRLLSLFPISLSLSLPPLPPSLLSLSLSLPLNSRSSFSCRLAKLALFWSLAADFRDLDFGA